MSGVSAVDAAHIVLWTLSWLLTVVAHRGKLGVPGEDLAQEMTQDLEMNSNLNCALLGDKLALGDKIAVPGDKVALLGDKILVHSEKSRSVVSLKSSLTIGGKLQWISAIEKCAARPLRLSLLLKPEMP